MGRSKLRRAPLVPPPLRSLARARTVTSEFHRLTRAMQAAREAGAPVAQLQAELEALGGRAAYQAASALTTARHRTAKYVFSALTRLGLRPAPGAPPLPLLEVGAVNTQLISVPWLATRAIDLRSSHPRIEQRDFFTLRPAAAFRVVVLAMVLNCVPSAASRGRMLLCCRAHVRPGGLLFVMLPLRCLTSSPFCSWERFAAALACAGFELVESKESPKVAFILARAVAQLADHRPFRMTQRAGGREGDGLTKNDFAVAFED